MNQFVEIQLNIYYIGYKNKNVQLYTLLLLTNLSVEFIENLVSILKIFNHAIFSISTATVTVLKNPYKRKHLFLILNKYMLTY